MDDKGGGGGLTWWWKASKKEHSQQLQTNKIFMCVENLDCIDLKKKKSVTWMQGIISGRTEKDTARAQEE